MTRAEEDYTLEKINEALGGKWYDATPEFFRTIESDIASGKLKRKGLKEL